MSGHWNLHGIPDRWLDYRAVGKRLGGTRFVAFKVPLKQSLTRQLSPSDVFGPWELLDALNGEQQELGLIIDLTNTARYYSLQDIPETLLCVKILTAGHAVPSDITILNFKRAVRWFLRNNEDNDRLIGVHCTHGLNRTGYLICRYLIDVDGMDPAEAVELFNLSRGHAIERRNYLEDLRHGPRRSNEGMERLEQEPQRGEAVRRPSYTSSDSDGREERRPLRDSRYHRSPPPQGSDRRSQHRPRHGGLLPTPPFRPLRPYRWTPPHPDSEWRRRPRPEESGSRYPPAAPQWSPARRQEEVRWRAPPPLPHYSPRWTPEPNGWAQCDEEWSARTRLPVRSAHVHRVNGHDAS